MNMILEHIISKKPQYKEEITSLYKKGVPINDILKQIVKYSMDASVIKFTTTLSKYIEPTWNYQDKFFTVLLDGFDQYLRDSKSTRLLIEAPPRTGKTEFASGFGLVYLLSTNQNKRFLVVAGNNQLKRKVKKRIASIVSSHAYQKFYKDIRIEVNNDSKIILSNGNEIDFITTNSSTPTGEGYHFIFFEDFLTHTMSQSEAKTHNAFEQYNGIITRKQRDPVTKVFINNQRLSSNDLSSLVIERCKESGDSYMRFVFPYRFDPDLYSADERRYILQNDSIIEFEENEYLVKRFNEEDEIVLKADIGKKVFITQFQQRPELVGGMYLKRESLVFDKNNDMINHYLKNNEFLYTLVSVDCANTSKKENDRTACVVAGYTQDGKIYIIDVITARYEYAEMKRLCSEVYSKYLPTYLLIERKANGEALYTEFKRNGIIDTSTGDIHSPSMFPVVPKTNKQERLQSCEFFFENQKVILPEFSKWGDSYINELLNFPNGRHDDQVDATTMLLNFIKDKVRTNRNIFI